MEGIIRQAKSSQKKQNYFLSTMNELVGLLGKAKYMMPEGALEGHEHEWARMHTSSNPVLTYKPVDLNGNAAQPMPLSYNTPIDALSASVQQADNDLKSTIGIYDPSLGKEQTGEKSGIAILAKQRQSDVTTSMFSDNMCKSLKLAGSILLEIIPIIYDNDRIVRVAKDNEIEDEMVDLASDIDVNFHVGEYTASVTIGPAGESQRQEAIEAMNSLMTVYPAAAPAIADLIVSRMDWAGASEIAERLKAMNPALQDGQIPEALQQQIQEAQANYENQINALTQENQSNLAQMQSMQALIADLESKLNRAKNDTENDTLKIVADEKKNAENNQTKIVLEMMKSGVPMEIIMRFMDGLERQASQPLPPVQMRDEYVIPGVNDIVTQESQTTPVENLEQQQQQVEQSQQEEIDPRDEILQTLTSPRNSIR